MNMLCAKWLRTLFHSLSILIVVFSAYVFFQIKTMEVDSKYQTEMTAELVKDMKNKVYLIARFVESRLREDDLSLVSAKNYDGLHFSSVKNTAPNQFDIKIADAMSYLLESSPDVLNDDLSLWYFRSNLSKTFITKDRWELDAGIFSDERCMLHKTCPRFTSKRDLIDDIIVSPVYADYITKSNVISLVSPIYYKGEIVSTLGYDIILNKVRDSALADVQTQYLPTGEKLLVVDFDSYILKNVAFSYPHRLDNTTVMMFNIPVFSFINDDVIGTFVFLYVLLVLLMMNYHFNDEYKDKFKKIELISLNDALTGLYNRNVFETEAFKTATTGQYNAICFDGDKIKMINDKFGHKAGDDAIKVLAECIKGAASQNDFVIRTGGDEFVVVQPNASPQDAQQLTETATQQVLQSAFMNGLIALDMSSGIAYSEFDGENYDVVVSRADRKLYQVKKLKKNTEMMTEPSVS
ncbi:MAG: GGDEF domain-containing protein [Vibrio sp.]